jgi:hypothetical protein
MLKIRERFKAIGTTGFGSEQSNIANVMIVKLNKANSLHQLRQDMELSCVSLYIYKFCSYYKQYLL